jgi:hypothetical protein
MKSPNWYDVGRVWRGQRFFKKEVVDRAGGVVLVRTSWHNGPLFGWEVAKLLPFRGFVLGGEPDVYPPRVLSYRTEAEARMKFMELTGGPA